MKSGTAIQICSAAILVSFFFPLFRWHGFEMSGLNYILSDQIFSYKYVLLLIPFSALFLFLGAANNKYLFSKEILSLLPIISLVIITIARFTDHNNNNSFYDKENPFVTIASGFWLLLFFSLLLPLIKEEKKKAYSF